MDTIYISMREDDENYSRLVKPAEEIKKGNLVVFPTETVYGIGANALDEKAVLKIFEAKGRAPDNPLIAHVSSMEMLYSIAEEIRRNRAKAY